MIGMDGKVLTDRIRVIDDSNFSGVHLTCCQLITKKYCKRAAFTKEAIASNSISLLKSISKSVHWGQRTFLLPIRNNGPKTRLRGYYCFLISHR